MKAYLKISIGNTGNNSPAKLQIVLNDKTCPRSVLNFTTLLSRQSPEGFKGSSFHRLIPKFMIQGGDFTNNDGTGGVSIYGDSFPDENFIHSHEGRGILAMANSGRDTNGSQFFITFRATRHLDGKHVVFGHVDMDDEDSVQLLDRLERIRTGSGDVPSVPIQIIGGEVVKKVLAESKSNNSIPAVKISDGDEIDLDDDEVGEGASTPQTSAREEHTESEELPSNNSKKSKLQDRLRKLKMKINQSRQLNHKEVLTEGERIGSKDAKDRHRKQTAKQEKQRKEKDWSQVHSKALSKASSSSSDEMNKKGLVQFSQSGNDALRQAQKKADIREKNMYSVNDHFNPEGQYRNYERSLNSVRSEHLDTSTLHSNPDEIESNRERRRERDGAKRLAAEFHRRGAKADKRKQKEMDFEGDDVSFINKRNKHFNEKINRTYDKHTAEIKKNLERGTAL